MGYVTDALQRARQDKTGASTPPPEAPGPRRDSGDGGAAKAAQSQGDPSESNPGVAITRSSEGDWPARAVLVSHEPSIAESFRHFALQVRAAMTDRPGRTVMVTSALRFEGKTTIATNLALALASMAADRRLALVELDLRRPSIGSRLGIVPAVGIESVLADAAPLAAACIRTELAPLDVFAVRKHCEDAHEILSRDALQRTIEELNHGYDIVVIDTPPVLLVPDAELIAQHAEGCLAVVRGGTTLRSAFHDMLDLLPREKLIGCFLNDTRPSRHARRYYEYYATAEDAASEAT